MSPTRTELITKFSALRELSAEWDSLWKADPRRTVFGCFAWASAFWQAYGSGRSLCAPVVWRDNRVVGILPLVAAEGTLRFLGDPRSDYNDMLCEQRPNGEILGSALRALSAAPVPWRHCILQNLPEGSHVIAQLAGVEKHTRLRTHLSFAASCPSVDLTCDRERILGDVLRKKSLRRHEKKLSRLGGVSFRHIESRKEAQAHLPRFFRQHIARRALAGDRSLFCDEEARAFYETLVNHLDPERELRFSVVEIDGKPVAYHFGFETNGTFVWYKPTFDVDLWDCSPGEVLIKRLFEYVRERGSRKFDFTVGDETFKSRFANQVNSNYTLHVFPSGPRAVVSQFAVRARDRLRRHPVVFRRVKTVRANLTILRHRLDCALKRRGVLGAAKSAVIAAWRKAVFARDVVIVFASEGNGQGTPMEDLEVRDGTLSDLACLAGLQGDFLTSAKLAKARDRLRRGDRLYTVWKRGECAHIAWTGVRCEISASSEVGDKCRIKLDGPATFIYDGWTFPPMRGQGIAPTVLRTLVGLEGTQDKQYWVWCPRDNRESYRSIIKAGFKPRYRMQRTRLLGWITLSRVVADASLPRRKGLTPD